MSHHHDHHDHHGHYDGQEPIIHDDDDHNHDHGHAGHDHSNDITPALQYSLYEQIKVEAVQCCNESTVDSAKKVLQKPWVERLNLEPEVISNIDPELLLTVPFADQVNLHSILLYSSESSHAPRTIQLYRDNESLDFSDVAAGDKLHVQKLDLPQSNEVVDIPLQRKKFQNVQTLTLYFMDNWGAALSGDGPTAAAAAAAAVVQPDEGEDFISTRFSYLAFKGTWTKLTRGAISVAYEAAPNPADHKLKGTASMTTGSSLGY